MISAIREIAEKKDTSKEAHTLTANYLKACSMIFENGILSHEKITSMSSTSIANMTGDEMVLQVERRTPTRTRYCVYMYNFHGNHACITYNRY